MAEVDLRDSASGAIFPSRTWIVDENDAHFSPSGAVLTVNRRISGDFAHSLGDGPYMIALPGGILAGSDIHPLRPLGLIRVAGRDDPCYPYLSDNPPVILPSGGDLGFLDYTAINLDDGRAAITFGPAKGAPLWGSELWTITDDGLVGDICWAINYDAAEWLSCGHAFGTYPDLPGDIPAFIASYLSCDSGGTNSVAESTLGSCVFDAYKFPWVPTSHLYPAADSVRPDLRCGGVYPNEYTDSDSITYGGAGQFVGAQLYDGLNSFNADDSIVEVFAFSYYTIYKLFVPPGESLASFYGIDDLSIVGTGAPILGTGPPAWRPTIAGSAPIKVSWGWDTYDPADPSTITGMAYDQVVNGTATVLGDLPLGTGATPLNLTGVLGEIAPAPPNDVSPKLFLAIWPDPLGWTSPPTLPIGGMAIPAPPPPASLIFDAPTSSAQESGAVTIRWHFAT